MFAWLEPVAEATRLAGGASRGASRLDSQTLAAIGVSVAALFIVNFLVWAVWRWLRRDPLERAFLAAAAQARVGRQGRRALRAMAGAIGCSPVTLLLSEHAFDLAAASMDVRAAGSMGVERLRRRVFG